MPRSSFSTSVACSVPITPVTAPSTPASEQLGTAPSGGASRVQAAVAWAARVRLEYRELALEPQDRGRDQGAARQHAGVGHQEAGGEIVGAVADQIVAFDQGDSALSAFRRSACGSMCSAGVDRGGRQGR